jgi:hypothetical protein
MMNKTNLLLDFGILAGFLLAIEPFLTGIALHEWLSIGFAALIVIHLLLHWKWIINVGGTFFKKLFHSSRLKFVVDSLLFISFVSIMVSGLMISKTALPALGIHLSVGHAWRMLHSLSANTTLVLVGLHFALSWNWVVSMTRRYLLAPVMHLVKSQRVIEPAKIDKEALEV